MGPLLSILSIDGSERVYVDPVNRQHQFVPGSPVSYDYNAYSQLSSDTSTSTWTIYRIEVYKDGSTVFKQATTNPSSIWDDRATLTYV
jgi:hypothetical protein